MHEDLTDYIKTHKKTMELFFDIETFKYNRKAGKTTPTEYKGGVYSVAISWLDDSNNIKIDRWARFEDFFDYLEKINRVRHFKLIAHNGDKFDNHYLLKDLTRYYNLERHQEKLEKAPVTRANGLTRSETKKGHFYTLESRVKSRSNLSFYCKLKKVSFETQDTYPITHQSLGTLSHTLARLGFMPEENQKTDLAYNLYDLDYNMTPEQERDYSRKVWQGLNSQQVEYITNDVIILAELRLHYSDIFPGFKWDVMTISQNILASYIKGEDFTITDENGKARTVKTYNQLARFQLLLHLQFLGDPKEKLAEQVADHATPWSKIGEDKITINLSDFDWDSDLSFYGQMKKFYKGGLNFYNDKYIGKTVTGRIKGYDLNSSYPNVMYNYGIPTYLKEINTGAGVISIDRNDPYYYFLEIDTATFNKLVSLLKSRVLRQMFVKYYTSVYDNVYINSNTVRLMLELLHVDELTIPYLSKTAWECQEFGAREKISDFYYIKTQGKAKKKLIYNNPSDIHLTDEINTQVFIPAEIMGAKLNLNGIYGIPALRPFFNYFYLDPEGEPVNEPNGFKNSSRNIVFASFVTSQAFYNLLIFLKDVPSEVIDDGFLYCDTDSMYFKDELERFLDKSHFHQMNLGAWKCEHERIEKFKVLNHKKYAFADPDEDNYITAHAGGISDGSFNTDMDWDTFANDQFTPGFEVPVIRSVLAKDGSMIVYDSSVLLDLGSHYFESLSEMNKFKLKTYMFKARQELDENPDLEGDGLYLETDVGSVSLQDIYAPKFETNEIYSNHELLVNLYQEAKSVLK